MKKSAVFIIVAVITIIVISLIGWQYFKPTKIVSQPALVGQASYLCQNGKTVEAKYYQGSAVSVKPSEMPVPNGQVELELSDGRQLTLPQTISASGIRYANADESLVFWSKGNTAFITESGGQQTYSDCVAQ